MRLIAVELSRGLQPCLIVVGRVGSEWIEDLEVEVKDLLLVLVDEAIGCLAGEISFEVDAVVELLSNLTVDRVLEEIIEI